MASIKTDSVVDLAGKYFSLFGLIKFGGASALAFIVALVWGPWTKEHYVDATQRIWASKPATTSAPPSAIVNAVLDAAAAAATTSASVAKSNPAAAPAAEEAFECAFAAARAAHNKMDFETVLASAGKAVAAAKTATTFSVALSLPTSAPLSEASSHEKFALRVALPRPQNKPTMASPAKASASPKRRVQVDLAKTGSPTAPLHSESISTPAVVSGQAIPYIPHAHYPTKASRQRWMETLKNMEKKKT